jgi:predicted lipoprotein with Yx(FWY)xxD motif
MNATGVAQRRGFAIIVLLAAVALAAWLIQARLDNPTKAASNATGTDAAQAAPAEAAPAEAAPSDSAAPAGDAGYGAAGAGTGQDAGAPGGGAAAAPAGFVSSGLTGKKSPRMGDVVADSGGWTAYRFDKDVKGSGKSACNDACATAWPPMLVDNPDQLQITGIDKNLVSTITRQDGGKQLTINGWPVYRFAADGGPSKWKGQGQKDTWWVIKPTGARNLSCLPPGTVPPAN